MPISVTRDAATMKTFCGLAISSAKTIAVVNPESAAAFPAKVGKMVAKQPQTAAQSVHASLPSR